jgi:hypothetical protein
VVYATEPSEVEPELFDPVGAQRSRSDDLEGQLGLDPVVIRQVRLYSFLCQVMRLLIVILCRRECHLFIPQKIGLKL